MSHQIDYASFRRAVDRLPIDALSDVRMTAANDFASTLFPDRNVEDWKYTSLDNAARISNAWLAGPLVAESTVANVPILEQIDACWLVIRNGVLQTPVPKLPAGITLRQLTTEMADSAILADDPLSKFNAALLTDAIYLHAVADSKIDMPLGLLLLDTESGQPQLTQNRIIIDVDKNATLNIVEAHCSFGGGDCFSNTIVQLTVAASADVNYVRFQNRSREHESFNRLNASIENNGSLQHASFDLGGSMVRNDISVTIDGVDAEVDLKGIYLAGEQQHIDNHTRVDHRIGPGKSSEEYRGVLNGKARCVFNGKAIVHAGADGTDAQQANHNLLLSAEAEIDTKPELEIYADDVKCSHGATTGQLDETALFYLRTRGLDVDTATRLMTRAFVVGLLTAIPVRNADSYIREEIESRLDNLTGATSVD